MRDPAGQPTDIVRSADGLPLALWHLSGDGPILLFAHATGFAGGIWEPVARRLGERWSCWAVDFRGHGHSPAAPDDMAWDRVAEDAAAVAHHLSPGGAPIAAAGHSMGGAALLGAAEAHPRMFSGIWAWEPVVFPPSGAERSSEAGPERPAATGRESGKQDVDPGPRHTESHSPSGAERSSEAGPERPAATGGESGEQDVDPDPRHTESHSPFDSPDLPEGLPSPKPEDNPLAAGALRRRATFADRASAHANFSSKPPLDVLAPESLDAYLGWCFEDAAGGFTLRCRPEVEARTYVEGARHALWDRLPRVVVPVTIARGRVEQFSPSTMAAAVADRLPRGRLATVNDLGHFGPLEDPERIATMIEEALSTDRPPDPSD